MTSETNGSTFCIGKFLLNFHIKIIACIRENFMFFIWQLTSLRKPKPLAINHPSLDVCLTKLSHWVDIFSEIAFWFSIHLFSFICIFLWENSENEFKIERKYTSIKDFSSLWLSSSRQEMIIKTKTWQVQQNRNELKIFMNSNFLSNSLLKGLCQLGSMNWDKNKFGSLT